MPTRIIDAWNGWYHINGNTYGTWIRGDPRGWRARHHREHVDGDYRHPPPKDAHKTERELSKSLMSSAVRLSVPARELACKALVESLLHQRIETLAIAVDDHHFHILARFRIPRATRSSASHGPEPTGERPWASATTRNQPIYAYIRHVVGLAKSRTARALSEAHHCESGGVWAKRFKITAIADRSHQVEVFKYILRHKLRGAAIWSFRDSGM